MLTFVNNVRQRESDANDALLLSLPINGLPGAPLHLTYYHQTPNNMHASYACRGDFLHSSRGPHAHEANKETMQLYLNNLTNTARDDPRVKGYSLVSVESLPDFDQAYEMILYCEKE